MNPKRLTREEFIIKAKSIHGDKYDYSNVVYVWGGTKVKIICPLHGEFLQLANNHLQGMGCEKCAREKRTKANTLSTEQFISRARTIHGDKYEYSKVNYTHGLTKVTIICPIHGDFTQKPAVHLYASRKKGCPHCGKSSMQQKNKKSREEFIEKASKIHNNFFSYENVIYEDCRIPVEIICPKHGSFFTTPRHHIEGVSGCPKCIESIGEKTIRQFLNEQQIEFIRQKTFDKCKYKRLLPFDFYLPKYHMVIEYQGEQHYKPVEHWGGEKSLKETQHRDSIKKDFCVKNNVGYLAIPYTEDPIQKLQEVLAKDIQQQVLPKCSQVSVS